MVLKFVISLLNVMTFQRQVGPIKKIGNAMKNASFDVVMKGQLKCDEYSTINLVYKALQMKITEVL